GQLLGVLRKPVDRGAERRAITEMLADVHLDPALDEIHLRNLRRRRRLELLERVHRVDRVATLLLGPWARTAAAGGNSAPVLVVRLEKGVARHPLVGQRTSG